MFAVLAQGLLCIHPMAHTGEDLGCQVSRTLQMPTEREERQVQNLVMCSCREHPKSSRKAPSPMASKHSGGGHGHAPKCTLCSLGITVRTWICAVAWGCNDKDAEHMSSGPLHHCKLSRGDMVGKKPSLCALSLEAINKTIQHLVGPSVDPAPLKAGYLKALPSSPNFLMPLLYTCRAWRGSEPSANPMGDDGEGAGERGQHWGALSSAVPMTTML